MRIAFVFAPYHHKKSEENLFVVDEDFGLFPPINPAYAAAIAERSGHTVRMFDINALLRTRTGRTQDILDEIARFGPDLLTFYFSTYMFQDTLHWVRRVRQRVDRPVVAGGINCTLYPAETLAHDEIDYCVVGHGHESFPRLLEAIGNSGRLQEITGIG